MEHRNSYLKFWAILAAGLMITFWYSITQSLLLLIVTILYFALAARDKLISFLRIMAAATLPAVSLFLTIYLRSSPAASIYIAAGLGLRIYSFAILGALFGLTTNAEQFAYSLMQQGRLAPKYAYGVLTAFHLLPTIKREWQNIRLAFRIRGIWPSPFSLKPIFVMLVNTIHWSDTLAMAMESKGFDDENMRTYYYKSFIKKSDPLFFLSALLLLCLSGFLP